LHTWEADKIVGILTAFKWDTLQTMFGCAHNSIIGFLSTMWINLAKDNSVLDGVPSPIIGAGRSGQRNADILLCKADKPFIVVEVETNVSKYPQKLESIRNYISSKYFGGLQFGLLIMSNLCTGDKKYKHNWEDIKEKVGRGHDSIALVSIEKENQRKKKQKIPPEESVLDKLKRRNGYYPWQIVNIDYWVYTKGDIKKQGDLVSRN